MVTEGFWSVLVGKLWLILAVRTCVGCFSQSRKQR